MKYSNGDRYEGEFLDNHMHGFGAYGAFGGSARRWRPLRALCQSIDFAASVSAGENPRRRAAVAVWRNGNVYRGEWRSSRMEGCGVKISKVPGKFIAEEGFFVVDEWAGDVMSCSVEQVTIFDVDGPCTAVPRQAVA